MTSQAPSDVQHRAGSLLDKYQVPPFSVLDTRQGYWQEARRAWLALGIRSELGRGQTGDGFGTARPHPRGSSPLMQDPQRMKNRAAGKGPSLPADHTAGWSEEPEWVAPKGLGATPVTGMAGRAEVERTARAVERAEQARMEAETSWVGATTRREADEASNLTGASELPAYANFGTASVAPGTSIFDPVLCELAYRWWCPPGGTILDPFAGGSVRGIVAAWLGHRYTGVDLSAAQIASNREQANIIMEGREKPSWIVGDSRQVIPTLGYEWADFVFTCPPYYDLEVYSDDPADLSAMTDWPAFLSAYGDVIGHSLDALKRDRFAAIVVSEIRGKDGIFRGLVPWTIRQFEMHGARYYNEAVLINSAGTLPMRVGRQFDAGRKLGRSHQNVLVFVKGNVPRTHEWGYEGTRAPDPQLELFDIAAQGADGRPA
jgi:hypothetical protein